MRAGAPHDAAAGVIDDRQEPGFAAVQDDVVRVEAGVADVVQPVRAEVGRAVLVEPVEPAPFGPGTGVGAGPVAPHGVERRAVESHFLEVIRRLPGPGDPAGGHVDFVHDVVDERRGRVDPRVAHVAVGQGQHGAAGDIGRRGARRVVSHRVPLDLQVVVLPGNPDGRIPLVGPPLLPPVETPQHGIGEVPELDLQGILPPVPPGGGRRQQVSPGVDLVRVVQLALPQVHEVAVHVDEQPLVGREDGESAPALLGLVDGRAQRVDGRVRLHEDRDHRADEQYDRDFRSFHCPASSWTWVSASPNVAQARGISIGDSPGTSRCGGGAGPHLLR